MRKPRGASIKTVGYVVVPLFAADFEQSSLDEAIKSGKIKGTGRITDGVCG
jgi:hypothetical protein